MHKSHKIVVPFPDPKPDQNAAYKLAYQRPSKINVVGSYALKTIIKSDDVLSIDMVVTMPASIFQEKDFLNYRYFYKRAYYLACIAAGLQGARQKEFVLKFEYLNGNTLHPILVARLNSSTSIISLKYMGTNLIQKRRRIRVYSSTFALSQLLQKSYFQSLSYGQPRTRSDQSRRPKTSRLHPPRPLSTTPRCSLIATMSRT